MFLKFINKLYDMCLVLSRLTGNSISFLDDRWTNVLFGYMPINEVPPLIKSEIDGKKIKLLKPMRQKGI